MKRSLLTVGTLVASLLVPVVLAAPALAACQPPDGKTTIYVISDKTFLYLPTNVASIWSDFPYGGTISYTKTKTAEQNASMTATASAEADAIFATVSASVGRTVGKSYSHSTAWTYSANVKADSSHKYRVHLYHWAVTFRVAKRNWYYTTCSFHTAAGWPQRVYHAPSGKLGGPLLWKLDKAPA